MKTMNQDQINAVEKAMGTPKKLRTCKWCIENEPEWSTHAKVWIHRRDSVDKACLNQQFMNWWMNTGKHNIGGSTEEEAFNAGWDSALAAIQKAEGR